MLYRRPIILDKKEYDAASAALGRVGIVMGVALAGLFAVLALGVALEDGKTEKPAGPAAVSQPAPPQP
jgi:hypothetical protein